MMERIEARKGTSKSIEADTRYVELALEKHTKCTNCIYIEFTIRHRSIGFYTARSKSHIFREVEIADQIEKRR